jgi:hypothetical protein
MSRFTWFLLAMLCAFAALAAGCSSDDSSKPGKPAAASSDESREAAEREDSESEKGEEEESEEEEARELEESSEWPVYVLVSEGDKRIQIGQTQTDPDEGAVCHESPRLVETAQYVTINAGDLRDTESGCTTVHLKAPLGDRLLKAGKHITDDPTFSVEDNNTNTVFLYVAQLRQRDPEFNSYGGIWSGKDGSLHIGFTKDVATRKKDLAALSNYPDHLSVFETKYSWWDLQDTQKAIMDSWPKLQDKGILLCDAYTDVDLNKVVVRVFSDIKKAREELNDRYDPKTLSVRRIDDC